MITFDAVTVTYAGAARPVLDDLRLEVEEGELCLVAGRTGSGKSTLLGAINGLVPHFTGGRLAGRVTVDGLDTRTAPPRELAHLVGVVGQDPLAGFVTDTVEDELAYTMEQLAVPPDAMRKRVEETLDLLGIAELRRRPLRTLSGGQQQRVAIGAALTAHPRVLVLDEPTSALDPTAAEDVLAAITRLVHDLGVTVVVAEHRLERVAQYADRLVLLTGDGRAVSGPPADVLSDSPVAPPVVELGRLAGWSPLPLSVRDARRLAGGLRDRLAGCAAPVRGSTSDGVALAARGVTVRYGDVLAVRDVDLDLRAGEVVALMGRNGSGKSSLLWAVQGSGPRHAGTVRVPGTAAAGGGGGGAAARGAAPLPHPAEQRPTPGTAPLPHPAEQRPTPGAAPLPRPAEQRPTPGAAPLPRLAEQRPAPGTAPLPRPAEQRRSRAGVPPVPAGVDPRELPAYEARRYVGLVPQTPSDLLYLDTVAAECAQADRESDAAAGSGRALLDRLVPGIPGDRHPRDLSEGQRLALVLAIQLVAAPSVVLLDEPTRGLDYPGKRHLRALVRELAAEGRSVVLATHDVEFVAAAADRVVVMAEGEVIADGPTADVVVASPAFAPQVAKVLAPEPWLTVDEVATALDRVPR